MSRYLIHQKKKNHRSTYGFFLTFGCYYFIIAVATLALSKHVSRVALSGAVSLTGETFIFPKYGEIKTQNESIQL